MSKIVLCPDHYYNCPICGKPCDVVEQEGFNLQIRLQGSCQVFYCYNPLVTDPLHYYSHIVEKTNPNKLAFHEFSLNLGNKSVLFSNNFLIQKSLIKNNKDSKPLELGFVIMPDFPNLDSLKKKVRTAITFS